ncbi:hypothetical protein EV643_110137 [Kribbella sp. VKM Ac-2527]|uniref:Beta-galactosidase-like protein n=1 Tax=Kribbella caucasensis TaxID=2512215 RepID=A0A4R6KA05_9ACTN|nr:hypothetical protein [Kribbella sp. VKM Ac-2527]TDO46754.1 hypothetical protein EV643_110137 [Kribbella sp. VKM Ac-2527]
MTNSNAGKHGEATGFQEQAPYDESIDLRTDFVMVYGLNDTTPQRIARWREAGYRVHLMTGISWGTYQDYLDGRWDGSDHWADAQTASDGSPILHGHSTDIPYMVPTFGFTEYLVQKLRPIIELGVEGIHLEEPEFWARAGYSESFKREWQAFFGEPWQPPHSTAEAHFRSGQLKQHLLSRSLDRVTSVLRDVALQQGRQVRFYVPTHSLLNYTQWQIISPESRLRTLPSIDGAIAQVWTGTSRTPNVYAGKVAERTFETAYLEYGIAQDLTRGTDRHMWFLHDPIEDHPDRTWEDYLANYQRTLVASLLHPGVSRYEVAPWPNRIFNRPYLREGSTERQPIPPDTATSYLIAMNSLRHLDQPEVRWANPGPRIGIALSDTAMFQRWSPGGDRAHYEGAHYDGLQDALALDGRDQLHFSDFYGLALPPLCNGQRVCPVQLENVIDTPDALDDVDVLVLSYEFQKPLAPGIHYALAGWVSRGGSLLYVGDGADPYHEIRSWWTGRYGTCADHLAEALGADRNHAGVQPIGQGRVRFLPSRPAGFTESPERAADLVAAIRELAEVGGHTWESTNWLSVQRGPYLVGAVLEEAGGSHVVEGRYLDLLDPQLGIVRQQELGPGQLTWLRDLTYDEESLLASAGRVVDWERDQAGIRFGCEAPRGVQVMTALRVPAEPAAVRADGAHVTDLRYDAEVRVLWLRHPGVPTGTRIEIDF